MVQNNKCYLIECGANWPVRIETTIVMIAAHAQAHMSGSQTCVLKDVRAQGLHVSSGVDAWHRSDAGAAPASLISSMPDT